MTTPNTKDLTEMTVEEKARKIVQIENTLYRCKGALEDANKHETKPLHDYDYVMDSRYYERQGPIFVEAAKCGLADFSRICVIIFRGELQAKIIALEEELKSMIK